jgi:DNA polymerase III delta subunit
MSLREFIREIDQGLPAPAYLFCVKDEFLRQEAIEAVKGLVPAAESDFNLHVFDFTSEDISVRKVLETADTFSFFGGRRITICTMNLQKLPKKDQEKLQSYLSSPAQGSVFVIFHTGTLLKDIKGRFKSLRPAELGIGESEIPLWLKERARKKGIEITDRACGYLIGEVGPEVGLLAAEVEKFSLLGLKRVDVDDIAEILVAAREYGVFDLTAALRQGNPDRVFRVYAKLKETAEDYGLIGALNWQYARELNLQSGSEKEEALKVFGLLNEADRDIKSSGRGYPLEYLLIRLLRLQSPSAKAR